MDHNMAWMACWVLAATLSSGCKLSVGGSGNCQERCVSESTNCEACCNAAPDFMRQDCLTTCACTYACCSADCGGGQPGSCSQCQATDPSVTCQLDMTTDDDNDGYCEYEGDCDDSNPSLNPGQQEIPDDSLDNDCNGITDADFDGDGYAAPADCDDDDRLIHPDRPEICENDIDENCNGETDEGCPTPCDFAAVNRSSVGCVYYAINTNPLRSSWGGDYGVVVSNVDDTLTANVVIEAKNGGVWTPVPEGTFSIPPLSLQTTVLALNAADGSHIRIGGAYRITSDLPVLAYQFDPLDGSTTYMSDASLLLPASALDAAYLVPAWPYGPADEVHRYPAHIQVVASAPTQVRVTSPIPTQAGSIPPLTPGVMSAFELEEGDVLQLTVADFMDSFTGAYIEADMPVAVFASNDCVNVPADYRYCCCEHLEEQVFGLQTWGKEYVAARAPMRISEPVIWQILAQQDNTTVWFNQHRHVTGLPQSVTLNSSEYVEYQVGGTRVNPGDFLITADKPILVTQFMVGACMVHLYCSNGDPSMVQAVPSQQFLERYVVLVPATWSKDFLVLIRRPGTTVELNDAPVDSGWIQVGSETVFARWEVARVLVEDGVHVLAGNAPFGVIVVGYAFRDSYAYPGGLGQRIINPI